jgi:hypothetical protein
LSPFDEAAAGMAEVEKMDEAVVATELERAFEENPATSNVERCPMGLNGNDTLREGGSGNENSWTILGRRPSPSGKLRRW